MSPGEFWRWYRIVRISLDFRAWYIHTLDVHFCVKAEDIMELELVMEEGFGA